MCQVASIAGFFNTLSRVAAEISHSGAIDGLKHWDRAQGVAFQLESEEFL